jgi:predicted transcriptional regulator
MPKKKVRISDYDLCRVGTVAHNRDFSARDLSEYLGKDTGPMLRRMLREGIVSSVSRGRYYPTKKGWRNIENACEGVSQRRY